MEKWQIYNIFNRFDNVIAGSTLKEDGFEYNFSLALHTGEEREKILNNRQKFMQTFDDEFKFISMLQVHSSKIVKIDSSMLKDKWSEFSFNADGMVTKDKNIVLNILTADCAAIIAYDKSGVIGAAHAGWRGTKDKIAINLIENMLEIGATKENIIVAISPCIKACCYEVGEDVAKHFFNFKDAIVKTGKDKWHLDISLVNKKLLIDYGIKEDNIELSSICTACKSDKYFSYRKECGCSGRFITYIGMK